VVAVLFKARCTKYIHDAYKLHTYPSMHVYMHKHTIHTWHISNGIHAQTHHSHVAHIEWQAKSPAKEKKKDEGEKKKSHDSEAYKKIKEHVEEVCSKSDLTSLTLRMVSASDVMLV
jgi:hypothetical protein